MARGERFDPEHLKELQWKARIATAKHHGVKEGVDPKKLDETGWGVIFASDADPAIREALSELLTHRRGQATRQKDTRYKEYSGASGYRHNNSKNDSLMRNGAGPDAVDPDRVPYYLLMVGDPEAIPFRFQYQLDVLAAGTPRRNDYPRAEPPEPPELAPQTAARRMLSRLIKEVGFDPLFGS